MTLQLTNKNTRNTGFAMSYFLIFAITHIFLPSASPFASGTHATLTTSYASKSLTKQNGGTVPAEVQQMRVYQHSEQTSVVSTSTTVTARYAASSSATSKSDERRRNSFRQILTRFSSSKHNDVITSSDGITTPKPSLLSRLFFQYSTPLLTKAQHQPLDVSDAFELPSQRKMDKVVTSLQRIHQNVQLKAATKKQRKRRRSPVARNSVNTDSAASQAWLLTRALLLHQRRVLLRTGIMRLANTAIQAFPALLVARLLRLIEAGTAQPASKAVVTAVLLIGVLSIKMVAENQYFYQMVQCSAEVRGVLAGLVFDKSLRLPPGGGSGVVTMPNAANEDKKANAVALGSGGVLNLMQSDAGLVEAAALQLHTLWDGPLQIMVYTSLLFRYLGPSVFWGIMVILMTIPMNSVTLRVLNRLSRHENEAKDARTRRTAESISNMKLLKLQGWEQRFADDIRASRSDELRRHVYRGVVRALNSALSNAVPSIVLVVTLSAYIRTGQPIVASTIFTAISLFNQLRFPLFFYPMLIDSLANGRNAMKRITAYLASEEVVSYVKRSPIVNGSGGSIEMIHGTFLWPTISSALKTASLSTSLPSLEDAQLAAPVVQSASFGAAPALLDVNLKVNPGEIVAVIGGVGSGKTALIKGLLGELNPVPRIIVDQFVGQLDYAHSYENENSAFQPSVVVSGNVAYCSQEAWLPKGTIREAIVFGRPYNESRYFEAIYDAGLDRDIMDKDIINSSSSLSSRLKKRTALNHDTDVGEGGSALSGGQRARVALARALYAATEDTKVFLLDDSLSALDANVGSIVFERLTKRLRKSKSAALLVTNDPSIPRRCDKVVLMGKLPSSTSCSRIVDIGSYDELLARGHDLHQYDACIDADQKTIMTGGGEEMRANHTTAFDSQSTVGANENSIINTFNLQIAGEYEVPGNSTEWVAHHNLHSLSADHIVPQLFPDDYTLANNTVESVSTRAQHATADPDTNTAVVLEGSFIDNSPMKAASADENMSAGAVPISTYFSYLKSVRSPFLVFAMAASYLLVNGAQFYQQLTVARWTEVGHNSAIAAIAGAKYMKTLVDAAVFVSILLWIRSFLTMKVGVRASEFLHSKMLSSVFKAPMAFFDATPSGQLLSRFGKEIETVDRAVPDSIGSVLFCFLQIATSIAGLAGVVTSGMLVPLALVGVLYVKTMSLFRPAVRDLKRAEIMTRSPLYTHFGEALKGVETIRSIPGASSFWSRKHRKLSDTNLSVFHTVKIFDRWLSLRLETLGNAVTFSAAIASIILTRTGKMKSGSAGWGLTQSLAITGLMAWAVRCLTDLETHMMSVLRVKELTEIESEEVDVLSSKPNYQLEYDIQKEVHLQEDARQSLLSNLTYQNMTKALSVSSILPKDTWPWQGNIRFNNVSMRYTPFGPLVLSGMNLTVPAGTTLGVVGRTGSGKSSLLLTLFRIVEIEKGGNIEIDGLDIRSVGLEHLRRSLAIIPQDPVLFAGSVAYNLDATGNSSAEDMWIALEAASPSLAQQFRNADGLNTRISEGGRNLSLGQRQLMCLARALLRRSRVLVLDEATSSVDSKTDQEVQDSIRREFVDKGATVITVAHRLDTVLGYDKIAVLGDGHLLEYGKPKELLKNAKGELRKLVDADRRNKRKGSLKSEDNLVAI